MSKGFTSSYRIALLATAVLAMFAGLERECQQIHAWRHALEQNENRVADLNRRLAQPSLRLGHRIGPGQREA